MANQFLGYTPTSAHADLDALWAATLTFQLPLSSSIIRTPSAKLSDLASALDFANVHNDGVTESGAGLNAAYAACKAAGRGLWVPSGTYKCSIDLIFDGAVPVLCESGGDAPFFGVTFKLNGNVSLRFGNGIAQAGRLEGCNVSSFGGDTTPGIIVDCNGAGSWVLRNINVIGQGASGILVLSGNIGSFENVRCFNNAVDGIDVESGTSGLNAGTANALIFHNVRCNANGRHGLNCNLGVSHILESVICEGNTQRGLVLNGVAIYGTAYLESNGAGEALFDTDSVRCFLNIVNSTGPGSISDLGMNNGYNDLSNGLAKWPSVKAAAIESTTNFKAPGIVSGLPSFAMTGANDILGPTNVHTYASLTDGYVTLIESGTQHQYADVVIVNSVAILKAGAGAIYTITKDSANKINVYMEGGVMKIQNNTAGNITIGGLLTRIDPP